MVAEDNMDAQLGTITRAAVLQLGVGCCGRYVMPILWKLLVAPLSTFKFIEGRADTTFFFNNGCLIYLTALLF